MRVALAIARRDLAGVFYAPIAYVVGVAFLALSGLSFWALLEALADPAKPSVPGAVLRSFFGGTLLHWLVGFAVVALLSMRSIAEERRSGLWEAMLTTGASLGEVIVGKWLALAIFYTLLWVPTVAYILVLQHYLPPGASLDVGPIAAAYVFVLVLGAAMLAIGLAFSAATTNQVIAAACTFGTLVAWLMLGELAELPTALSMRRALELAARGDLRLSAVVAFLALIATSLTAAVAVASAGKASWTGSVQRLALVLCIAVSLVRLAAVHERSFDVSRNSANSLREETVLRLRELEVPVTLTIARPQEQVFDSVYDELRLLLQRMVRLQPRLRLVEIDPLTEPESVERWSQQLAIRSEDLASGGALIVQAEGRAHSIDLLAMATFSQDDLGAGSLESLDAERALRDAIADVTGATRITACALSAHGELSADASSPRVAIERWDVAAERLAEAGVSLRSIGRAEPSALKPCDVVVVLGPNVSLDSGEALALGRFQERGGGLLVALRSSQPGQSAARGLGLLLANAGIEVLPAVVVDPAHALEDALAWLTYDGYGEHSIVADFAQRRATLWRAPLALRGGELTRALVRASSEGYGETSVAEALEAGRTENSSDDLADVVVAMASEPPSGGRLVVFGSAAAFSSHWSERGIGGNERLLLRSVQWLAKREPATTRGEPLRLERIRLIMGPAALRHAFVLCVVLAPVLVGLAGALLWWWRRREVQIVSD